MTFILEVTKLELMKLTDSKKLHANAATVANLLKSLANRERLLILCQLVEGEKTAGDLWQQSNLSQSAFSQHLGVLRREKLVKTRKESQTIFYSLANDHAIKVLELMYKLYH